MLDEKDLQAIKALFNEEMDKKLQPVNNRLDRMESRLDSVDARLNKIEEDLAEVREHAEVTRDATNYLVEWVERIEKKVDDIA